MKEARNKKLLIVCFVSEIARRGKSTETVGRFMVTRERGEEGNQVWLLNGYEVFWSDKVLKLKRDVIAHTVNILNASELHILKWLTVCGMNFTSI